MQLDFSGYSDVGGRTTNEDTVYSGKTADGCLFIVADGLGGHDCGEIASIQAVDAIKNYMSNESQDVAKATTYANQSILNIQDKTGKKMRTTIAVSYITDKQISLTHIGDTRIYVFKNKSIIYQSKDHSVSQMAVDLGEISFEQIRQHNERNILTKALGSTEQIKAEATVFSTKDADALILCSDGFWEYIHENEMIEALSKSNSSKEWLNIMKTYIAKNAPQGNDNHSALVIRIKRGNN